MFIFKTSPYNVLFINLSPKAFMYPEILSILKLTSEALLHINYTKQRNSSQSVYSLIYLTTLCQL